MQLYIKQRWVGAGIATLIAAIAGWLIWHHPALPPLLVQSTPGHELVYDLPLATAARSTPPPATEDFFATTSAELRAKAAHTSQVTAHILRTQSSAVLEPEGDESVAREKHVLHVMPTAWVVELPTCSDAAQAHALVKKLRRMGLLAYVRSEVHVFVGPYIDRHKSDALQNMLEQKMHIHGTVEKFVAS